jgi:hypothetical protein
MSLREHLSAILKTYAQARLAEPFSRLAPVWNDFEELQEELAELPEVRFYPTLNLVFSVGKGNWARLPWLAFLDTRETSSAQRGVYCVFLFAEDMSGVYLTLAQGVTEPRAQGGPAFRREHFSEQKKSIRQLLPQLAERFRLDDEIDLHGESGYAVSYAESAIAHKLYPRDALPPDDEIEADIRLLLAAYRQYVESKLTMREERTETSFDLAAATEELIAAITARGFHYEPWQIAAFVTAVRTKPFVILAGVSGTGKSKLPALVAEAVGASCRFTPVRSDWTDSGDVIGFTNISGKFQPGSLLRAARDAAEDGTRLHMYVLDEMNIARVEHYAPELLSVIESREENESGDYRTRSLVSMLLADEDRAWLDVAIPSNFAVFGTVNMDESSHPFSRKVLDRAFTIELSTIRLTDRRPPQATAMPVAEWPISAWRPRAIQLSELKTSAEEETRIKEIIETLVAVNGCLEQAQLHLGYRSRDEIILFVLHANDIRSSFRDVDPLDLALHMKALPRIIGGTAAVRNAVAQLLGVAHQGVPFGDGRDASSLVRAWIQAGRPASLVGSRFPRTTGRLCLMFERFEFEHSTSFW